MKMRSIRLAAAIVTACLCGLSTEALRAKAETASAQTPALAKPQRELLAALVGAVDAASAAPETNDAAFRTHLLRASDGSHYVAFTVAPPPSSPLPSGPAAMYVRLATAQRVERSPIREWLAGNQTAPPPTTSNYLAIGDMPLMGATGNLSRRPPQTAEMSQLALLDLERRRERERNAERDRQRRAELEGRSASTLETLPFEDFDFAGRARGGAIQRALTTGPGDFFIYVAWADPASPKPHDTVRVIKKRLTLPAATTTDLTVGSIILADSIQTRAAPYPPTEQASHPYVIGLTEILPSADASFTDNENLSVVFQVINARAADNGKPNLDVAFEVVRVVKGQEQPVAALTPQNYSESTLPAEFDLRVGHPLFATVSAPLATLKSGPHRLKILVTDRVRGTTATATADFTVAATALSLLRDAPALGRPFQRESILGADVLPGILAGLRPASASPALQRAFELAAAGRFVDLMVEEPVPANEEGVRAALRGLAQLSIGEASSAVQFQRAQLLGAPVAVTRLLSGAARAMQSRDADAIAAWQEALTAGAARATIVPHLLDAYLRRGDMTRAAQLIAETKTPRGAWSRSTAAILIATQKESEAIAMLDARLAAAPADADAQWLLLHALFSQFARDPNGAAAARERFMTSARTYIDAKGANAALAEEWLARAR
jgi:hypothetical protein